MREFNAIYVPEDLLERVEQSFGHNINTMERHLLIWFIIDSWPYSGSSGNNWKTINDSRFKLATKNPNDRKKTRDWLEENGFIKIKKFKVSGGPELNYYIPNEVSQSYSATGKGKLIPYELCKKEYWNRLDFHTADDLPCQITRENMGLLSKKNVEKPRYKDEETEKKKRNRDLSAQYKLVTNRGSVKRGTKVNRLTSAWTHGSKELRKEFLLDGCEIFYWDLKAAQPTLIAVMSEDRDLLRDCWCKDALYQGIKERLKVTDREVAKKAFMAYAYGKNRGDWYGHKKAYAVQEWMKERYPKAANYVTKIKKDNHYTLLNHRMQNMEAEIFVDGILKELYDKGLPALTVHDSIYVREHDKGIAKEIAHKHLGLFIPDGEYELGEETVSTRESENKEDVLHMSN